MKLIENLYEETGENPTAVFDLQMKEETLTRLSQLFLKLESEILPKQYGPPETNSPYKRLTWYHKHVNLATLPYPELQNLRDEVQNCVRKYRELFPEVPSLEYFKSWGNTFKTGELIEPHYHQEALVSGVVYIHGVEYEHTGNTTYIFPVRDHSPLEKYKCIKKVMPFKPGHFLMHPSSIFHGMGAYTEAPTRFSMAFDFRSDPLDERYAKL